jgi:uncharacterized protein YpiB (UPF0302 family)|tara:strand:+ start:434 stop:685 length:252 start_codon:yes stop_codon:yes gene_type:complete
MKKNIEIDISLKFREKSTAAIIAKSLDPDNKDFPEGMTMSQSVKNNILEINFKSNNVMETLLNTVDEVLSMIDMTSKTLEKVK